jgi:hypothetical protein
MKANITEAASTSYQAQTVEKNTPNKPEGPFTTDIKNISVLIYTVPQTQPLHNTSEKMGTRSALLKKSLDTQHFVKKGRIMNSLENFYIYRKSVKDK